MTLSVLFNQSNMSQSVNKILSWSVGNQTVSQSINLSVSQSVSQLINQLINNESIKQTDFCLNHLYN